jgi:hypothetical protein
MKELYSFSIEVEREVEKTDTKKQKNKESGEMEEISVTKTVKEMVPVKIIIKEPNRRDVEEADMEYSIELSKCIKKGVLTKAMLAKKYSDTGGLLSEEDAQLLTRKYTQLAEQQSKYTRLEAKTKKNKKEQDKVDGLLSDLAELRREIVDLETAYSSVFNHTADTKAQNKVILWYLVNLSYYQENEDDDINSFFIGEALEDKIDEYYKIDEEGHDLFDVAKHKLMSFISFWYFSSGASKEDFDSLNKDIEEGNV